MTVSLFPQVKTRIDFYDVHYDLMFPTNVPRCPPIKFAPSTVHEQ